MGHIGLLPQYSTDLKLKGKILPILFNDNNQIGENLVQCAKDTILSPHSIINIPCERASKEVSNKKHFALAISVINICEPFCSHNFTPYNSIVKDKGKFPLTIVNETNLTKKISKGEIIATATPV